MTTLYTPLNQLATTVGSAYTAASGTLTLATGYGATIATEVTAAGAAAISSTHPVRISVVKQANASDNPIAPANRTVYSVTGISGDVLTIGAALEGTTDRNYSVGDAVRINLTAGTIADLNAVVTTGWDGLSALVNSPVSVTTTASAVFNKWHVCSGTTSNYTVTLPDPSGNAGKLIGFRMAAGLTKLITIAQFAAETIDGAASRVMWAGETAILLCDGTNWYKIAGKSIPMRCTIRATSAQNVSTSHVKIAMDQTDVDNTAAMADLANNQIVCRRSSTYAVSGQVFFAALSANRVYMAAELYLNGSGYSDSNVSGLLGAYVTSTWNAPVVLAATDTVQLWSIIESGTEALLSNASGSSSFLALVESVQW